MGASNTKVKIKARYFTFILYPDDMPSDWLDKLSELGVSMAVSPLHDVDEKKLKSLTEEEKEKIKNGLKVYVKPHYHVIYVARNPVTLESVRLKIKRKLGNNCVNYMEIVDCIENCFKYLTHESKSAIDQGKHIYDSKDIIYLNGFDIDRYVTLDESQKRELKRELLKLVDEFCLVSFKELMAFLRLRGKEFGIDKLNDVIDIVSSYPGIFRLAFDSNYQHGYRPKYANTVNTETGEINIGLAEQALMESAKDE
ncbi:replication protein [Clostridium perfringens]|nr:replication protein [Clostridium perfringens]